MACAFSAHIRPRQIYWLVRSATTPCIGRCRHPLDSSTCIVCSVQTCDRSTQRVGLSHIYDKHKLACALSAPTEPQHTYWLVCSAHTPCIGWRWGHILASSTSIACSIHRRDPSKQLVCPSHVYDMHKLHCALSTQMRHVEHGLCAQRTQLFGGQNAPRTLNR
jgi:hypothetical protein